MPVMQSRENLRQAIIDLLPVGERVEYKPFLQALSEAGLSEGIGEIDGMKATGSVERWLEADADGHPVHYIARAGVRSQG